MKLFAPARILLFLFSISVVGCEPAEFKITKKVPYSELVVTYNAEVQALDVLEAKKKSMISEFANQAQADTLNAALKSIGSAGQPSIPGNPNDALDRAVLAAEAQAGLLDKLGKDSATKTEYPEELKRRLSELDAEIAKQEERVERARQARDAAD
ncbi:MAG: hypothetical protein ACOVLE_01960 [Pirellula staleyi]